MWARIRMKRGEAPGAFQQLVAEFNERYNTISLY